jgi:hypothetical protein
MGTFYSEPVLTMSILYIELYITSNGKCVCIPKRKRKRKIENVSKAFDHQQSDDGS